jgi:hypothetical protein
VEEGEEEEEEEDVAGFGVHQQPPTTGTSFPTAGPGPLSFACSTGMTCSSRMNGCCVPTCPRRMTLAR